MAVTLHASRSGVAAMCSTSAPRPAVVPLCRGTARAGHAVKLDGRSMHETRLICRAGGASTLSKPSDQNSGSGSNPSPLPTVKIDNVRDPFATVVTVEYGEKLGELLETITALKNQGLNILRAKLVQKSGSSPRNVFYITDAHTSEKIIRSARLEEIRMTVINSLVAHYPESASALATSFSSSDNDSRPLGTVRKVVQTTIDVDEAPNGTCSVLKIETPDRPGLLVDIVRTLKDINLNVVSAEIDTIGSSASDEFFITYHGEPLNVSMVQLVTNALQYYLSLAEVAKEESY